MTPSVNPTSKTQEKRNRRWTNAAGLGIWSILQTVCMTLNIRSIKEEHDDVYTKPFIVALWHNRTAVPCYVWNQAQKPLKMCVLTSASKDGALVENICVRFGNEAVRGSSGRRGALAFVEMVRKLNEGNVCMCITPDGPKGPIYTIHPGIIKLASVTGLPIVPVCIEYENCWRIRKAWDKYAIPKPCSDVTVLWRKPFYVPADITEAQEGEYAERLTTLLSYGLPDFTPLNQLISCKSLMENK